MVVQETLLILGELPVEVLKMKCNECAYVCTCMHMTGKVYT